MLKAQHQFVRTLSQVSDALTVLVSWSLAYWLRFHGAEQWLPGSTDQVPFSEYLPYGFILVLVWFLSLQISGAYKSWAFSRLASHLFTIIKASGMAFLIVVAGTFFFARQEYSRVTLAIFLGVVVILLLLNRIGFWFTLNSLRRRGWNQRRVLFLGDQALVDGIRGRIGKRPELGLIPAGFIPMGVEGSASDLIHKIEERIHQEGINHVVIALRNEDSTLLEPVLSCLVDLNVDIRIVPDVSQFSILGFEVEAFDGLPILSLNQSPIVGWNAVLKRITDFGYGFAALCLFSPVMLTIAIIIKVTSRGPLFYSQERMGLNGKTFKMLKFRSMRVDAESQTGAVWAKQNDDRVTPIGKFLRRTSLDELPQLFNVLAGDMSCVGPRPERPVFVEKFRKEIPGYMLRHKVKAGMTGWAQVNGLRGNTSLEGRIEYDLYYITHWSLFFDLKIMFMTIFRGFIAPHAY